MKTRRRRTAWLLVLLLGGSLLAPAAWAQDTSRFSILVFSKTEGYRHASIADGRAALEALGLEHGFTVDATEDAAAFTDDNLTRYDAVVFLSTTGDVFDEAQEEAFRGYIQSGGGFVGIHSATNTEYEWPWYGELVGAYFDSHPEIQEATVRVEDRSHPATRMLPETWTRRDEWYNYRSSPRADVRVLATLDEDTYEGGTMGDAHPIAWAHEHDGGRAFYTGGGHTAESFSEPLFLDHLLGGIEWAAGATDASNADTALTGSFEKVVLDSTTTDPVELAVAPDGRVFFIERRGVLKVWDPETEKTHLAGYVPVATVHEDGMLGLTLDPGFEENHWLYLYYSVPGDDPKNRLARFTLANGKLDPDSDKTLLEVPTQREECCHTGGSLAFGPEGNLFFSTGDNTDPFASSGFAPIDERPGREPWDAQRTSANTQDLRGKILRIRPLPDGTYAIPDGNLFADSTEGRPEIYVMGNRNPYRIAVDQETGWLYWGEVGPDAGAPDSARGPAGHDEWNRAREAGNYGWPYFVGDNKAYHEYDFSTETSGPAFDPARPVNESPNNTGARVLPPAQPALIWYPYGPSEAFPELGAGGRTAMAGPVFHYDAATASPRGLPAAYDGSLLIYEWARNWIKEVEFDEAGRVSAIKPFASDLSFARPMDMELGPEGRLYLIEWGDAFWGGPNSKIVRLDYYPSAQRPPEAVATAEPTSGPAPLQVRFSAEGTRSGEALRYAWDFDGDGEPDARGATPSFTYETPGRHVAHLTVTDTTGMTATDAVSVVAGNTAPSVSIEWPVAGGIFDFDASIPYRVSFTGPEDEASSLSGRLVVQPYLGRDTHALPLPPQRGLVGTFAIPHREDYDLKEDLFAVFEARYTDRGTQDAPSLTSKTRVVLQPRHKEAEFAAAFEGARRELTGDIRTKENLRVFLTAEDGGYASYAPVNLKNIEALTLHVAPERPAVIEVRLDAPDGPLLAKTRVAPPATPTQTASSENEADGSPAEEAWQNARVPVEDPGGTHALFLVFEAEGQGEPDGPLLRLDWIAFDGPGMMHRSAEESE